MGSRWIDGRNKDQVYPPPLRVDQFGQIVNRGAVDTACTPPTALVMPIRAQTVGLLRAPAEKKHMAAPFRKAPDLPEKPGPFASVERVMTENDPRSTRQADDRVP